MRGERLIIKSMQTKREVLSSATLGFGDRLILRQSKINKRTNAVNNDCLKVIAEPKKGEMLLHFPFLSDSLNVNH